MTTVLFLFLIFVVLGALSSVPALIAYRKGHSALGFWLFGLLGWMPAIITALIVAPRPVRRRPAPRWAEPVLLAVVLTFTVPTLVYGAYVSF